MKTSDLNDSMQVLKENKLSVCKLPTPCLEGVPGLAHASVWLPTWGCSLARHSGPSLSFSWHSVAVVLGQKSKLNTMCPAGIWSHGEDSWRALFPQVRLPAPSAHSPPDSNAWCSSTNPQVSVPTSCKIIQTASGMLLWRPGTPHFLPTTKPVPNNSSP